MLTEFQIEMIFKGQPMRVIAARSETKIADLMKMWIDWRINQAY